MSEFDKKIPRGESEIKLPLWEPTIQAIIKDRVKSLDSSHDWGHHMRTLKLAENLLEHIGATPGERVVARAGVMLHDNFMYPKNHPLAKQETDIAADQAKIYLEGTDFPKELVPRTHQAIRQSSFIKGERPETTEAMVVYISDKLDQSGIFGYLRYLASGGKMERELYNPDDVLGKQRRKREPFKFTFDALLNRIPKIQRSLKNEAAIATAKKRNEFLKFALKESEQEISESKEFSGEQWLDKTGTSSVEKLFQEAGKNNQSFYNLEDPLGKGGRELMPEVYPIDSLVKLKADLDKGETFGTPPEILERRKKFLEEFFREFEYELEGRLEFPPDPISKVRYVPEIPQ